MSEAGTPVEAGRTSLPVIQQLLGHFLLGDDRDLRFAHRARGGGRRGDGENGALGCAAVALSGALRPRLSIDSLIALMPGPATLGVAQLTCLLWQAASASCILTFPAISGRAGLP